MLSHLPPNSFAVCRWLGVSAAACAVVLTGCDRINAPANTNSDASSVTHVARNRTPTASTTAAPAPQNGDVIIADMPATLPPAVVGLKKADFPVYLEGVPSLLHPIVPSVSAQSSYTNAKRGNSPANYFQQTAPYTFSANVYNLVFENIKTRSAKRLFSQDNYLIKSVFYPYVDGAKTPSDALANDPTRAADTANLTTPTDKKLLGHFIYEVKELPDDNDSKTNIDDQLALYMSDDTGNHLTKLHPIDQYVKTTYWLPEVQRFYFTTQADTNGDGLINENDHIYNYVIDFAATRDAVNGYRAPTVLAYNYNP